MKKNNYDSSDMRSYSPSAGNKLHGVPLEIFQHVFMGSPFGHVITAMNDKDTPIVFVNRSFEKITGFEASEAIGRSWQFLLEDDQDHEALERFQEAVELKHQHTEVVRRYKDNGTLFYNELISYPVLDDNGELTHYVWVLRDVTSSIVAENNRITQLVEQDRRFSAHVEKSNELLWRLDFHPPIPMDDPHADQIQAVFDRGVFTEANDAAARYYELEKGFDLHGRPLNFHMDDSIPENRKMVTDLIQNRFLIENAVTHERGIDGSDVVAMSNITPGIKNGAVTHLCGASLVITELFNVQEDLKKSKNELAAQSKALEQKNIALKELVAHIGLEQKEFKERVMTNIKEVALPSLERIKLNIGDETYIDLHRSDLENLASSFGLKVNEIRMKLTPREMEVCNLVRNGLSNKEIARVLKIAVHTVEKHRRMARKKLGLNRKNVNLHSYLNAL